MAALQRNLSDSSFYLLRKTEKLPLPNGEDCAHTPMKDLIMVRVLLLAFAIGSLLDFFMESIGMGVIFHAKGFFDSITCYAIAFACLALRVATGTICSRTNSMVYGFMRFALFASLFISFYASVNAVGVYIIGKQSFATDVSAGLNYVDSWTAATLPVKFVGAALVLYLVLSPILLSYLLKDHSDQIRRGG